jgi:hypothetical protein
MKTWMVRFLSRDQFEFFRLFLEREDAVRFASYPGDGCMALDTTPREVTPEEVSAYSYRSRFSLC